ncbi:putative sugar O-methyltransferase [Amycolatopsis sp. CA-126428]|uniref:putative sugar O-methyltransferase n=1 Tax=Amycolatopsis sp. CA-126428 TaxID=2073158 RepID=UPI0018EBC633|nr:putative sugar O-methyltransferase [Amycolatopsis sp. CA-126428]
MTAKYGRSPLWTYNNQANVVEHVPGDLHGFKSGAVNYKLALWDPRANGVRYLKALIYHLASGLDEANLTRLRAIRNREVGDPISVRCHGEPVCMDYLQATFELAFLGKHVDLDGCAVLEIGAGYGRTCHAVLSNHDVASYTIVDLPNSLALAEDYLRQVLDDERFAKIRFVLADNADELYTEPVFDLCVNIDSFAEMDETTVRNYLALIADRCRRLYVNNPVAKYLDKSLDDHAQGDDVVQLALQTGLLRDVIDVHDSDAIEGQVGAFTDAYRPDGSWELVEVAPVVPWSYYRQALYQRTGAA